MDELCPLVRALKTVVFPLSGRPIIAIIMTRLYLDFDGVVTFYGVCENDTADRWLLFDPVSENIGCGNYLF